MYSGTLIEDLFGIVDGALSRAKLLQAHRAESHSHSVELHSKICHCTPENSQPEQFSQPLGLSPADWNLSLLLVIHAQLVRALEPRNNFTDAVDIYQVGAVRPPEKIRV
jgi:hypothetical protein